MRTIKELLQLMLDNQHVFENGLCGWACALYEYGYISEKEYIALYRYIHQNKPSHVVIAHFFWWVSGDIEPRIAWIKEQIKKFENENH